MGRNSNREEWGLKGEKEEEKGRKKREQRR